MTDVNKAEKDEQTIKNLSNKGRLSRMRFAHTNNICPVCEKGISGIIVIEQPSKDVQREHVAFLNIHDIDETSDRILITGCFELEERKRA